MKIAYLSVATLLTLAIAANAQYTPGAGGGYVIPSTPTLPPPTGPQAPTPPAAPAPPGGYSWQAPPAGQPVQLGALNWAPVARTLRTRSLPTLYRDEESAAKAQGQNSGI